MPASGSESKLRAATHALPGADRFRVLKIIHTAHAGVLYEAEDAKLKRVVAVKALRHPTAEERENAEREFEQLRAILHPNLLTLHEMIVMPDACYFVLERSDGPTLTAWCKKSETPAPDVMPSDEQRLRGALQELAQALSALHGAGKLHLHVRPETVRIRPDGRVVLDHFSLLLKSFGETPESMPGIMHGSVEYLSPEQSAASSAIGPETDWYALGAILYEALVGRPPFSGSVMQVIMEKQAAPPAPPRAFVPDVPKDLERLCVELLAVDPDARPEGAEVVRRLAGLQDDAVATLAELAAAPAVFVSRDEQLERLQLAFDASRAGSATVAYVAGPAGRGKSTLLRRFVEQAEERVPSVAVLQARCHPFEHVPGRAMDQLLDGLGIHWNKLRSHRARELIPKEAGVLARLFPVLGRAAAETSYGVDAEPVRMRDQAFAVLRDAFGRLCGQHAVLIVVDDVQWLDADTAALLSELLRPPEPPNLLLVLAGDCQYELPDAPAKSEVLRVHVPLPPLSEEEALVLARALGSTPSGEPYQIVERGQDVARRLAELDEPARHLAELCAVAGQPLAVAALRDADGFDARLAKLAELRLLRVTDRDRVEPAHELVRRAVLHGLDATRLKLLHLELGEALESEASPVDLARHFYAAEQRIKATRWARTAAHHAMATLSFGQAAELYGLLRELDASDWDVALGYAEALAGCGRLAEAAAVYADASRQADAVGRLALERRRAGQLLRSGHVTEGLAALDKTLSAVGTRLARTPRRAVFGLLLRLAWLRLRGTAFRSRHASEVPEAELIRLETYAYAALALAVVDNIRGADFVSRYLKRALQIGEPEHIARALSMSAFGAALRGAAERADELAGRARELALGSRNPWVLAAAVGAEGTVHFFIENAWKKALAKYEQAEAFLRSQSRPLEFELDGVELLSCMSLQWLGELAELERRVRRQVHEAERRGDVYSSITMRTRFYLLWLVRDDPERAERDLEACREGWVGPEQSFHVQHFFLLHARCECALYRGDWARAADLFAESARPLKRSVLLRLSTIRASVRYLEGRIILGEALALAENNRRDLARKRAKAALRPANRLAREAMPIAEAWSMLLEAAVLQLNEHHDRAEPLLRRAIASLERSETMLFAVAARRRLGELVGGRTGHDLIVEADDWMRERGVFRPARLAALLVPGSGASNGPLLLEGAREM